MVGIEGGRDLEAERPAGGGGVGPGSAGGRGVTGGKDAGVSGGGGVGGVGGRVHSVEGGVAMASPFKKTTAVP